MAYPRDLVRTISEAFRLPESTVAVHDRLLAESGLRTSGGRGRSAPHVRPEDAARLLIAVGGSPIVGPSIRDTAQNVLRYSNLSATDPIYGGGGSWDIRGLSALPVGHRFSDALSEIVRLVAKGLLNTMDDVWQPSAYGDRLHDPGHLKISVDISTPVLGAMISFHGQRSAPDEVRSVALLYREAVPEGGPETARNSQMPAGDLNQNRRFTDETLRKLAPLFKDEHN